MLASLDTLATQELSGVLCRTTSCSRMPSLSGSGELEGGREGGGGDGVLGSPEGSAPIA